MHKEFQIHVSGKSGLNSNESYLVTRGKTGFLRILGGESNYDLMTATADEDNGYFRVCKDQLRLVEAALRLGAELETNPLVQSDWRGREYVQICGIWADPEQNPDEFDKELTQLLNRYFELYDSLDSLQSRADDEMRDLYDTLAIDDLGGDVYLSDGVWLSSDGSLDDRGR